MGRQSTGRRLGPVLKGRCLCPVSISMLGPPHTRREGRSILGPLTRMAHLLHPKAHNAFLGVRGCRQITRPPVPPRVARARRILPGRSHLCARERTSTPDPLYSRRRRAEIWRSVLSRKCQFLSATEPCVHRFQGDMPVPSNSGSVWESHSLQTPPELAPYLLILYL